MLAPVGAEDFLNAWFKGCDGPDDADNVEVVPIIKVVADAVAAPSAAAHREREWHSVVKASAGGEAMRLIDDDPADRQVAAHCDGPVGIGRMQADGMTRALMGQDPAGDAGGIREIARAIQRGDPAQLFARQGMIRADPVGLDRQKARAFAHPAGQALPHNKKQAVMRALAKNRDERQDGVLAFLQEFTGYQDADSAWTMATWPASRRFRGLKTPST